MPQMQHLNSNQLVATSIRTSGPRAGFDNLLQVCFLPVDNFIRPATTIIPFYVDIIPKRPENLNGKVYKHLSWQRMCEICRSGIDAYDLADRFEEWFARLDLPHGKQIVPLTHGWNVQYPFLVDWLGYKYADYFFSKDVRDIQAAALFLNDRANTFAEPCPFPKVTHTYIMSQMKIEKDPNQDCIQDCLNTIYAYRTMLGYTADWSIIHDWKAEALSDRSSDKTAPSVQTG